MSARRTAGGKPQPFRARVFQTAELFRTIYHRPGYRGLLDSTSIDPLATASDVYGGDVVGFKLNVDFSDAGFLPSLQSVAVGDLTLHDFAVPGVNGLSVRQFFAGGEDELWLGEGGLLPVAGCVVLGVVLVLCMRCRGPSWQALARHALTTSATE